MIGKNLKTFSFCICFVLLFGVLGFLVASIVNTAKDYIETSMVEVYYTWVKTQMFAAKYLSYYLFAGILFACIGLIIICIGSQTDFIKT